MQRLSEKAELFKNVRMLETSFPVAHDMAYVYYGYRVAIQLGHPEYQRLVREVLPAVETVVLLSAPNVKLMQATRKVSVGACLKMTFQSSIAESSVLVCLLPGLPT